MPHYQRPTPPDRVFNSLVAGATRLGLSLFGSRILRVPGRKTGEWRTTPVNLLTHDGKRYLVAPRGETQWVRNLRVAKHGELVVGRKVERFVAEELDPQQSVPVLRAYLRRWAWEVGRFFGGGVSAKSTDEEIAAIAPEHPVFVIAAS